jgi:hypothetical protein
MRYYIRDILSGEWMRYGYDEGCYDEDSDTLYGDYWYLVEDEFQYASGFDSEFSAQSAIHSADMQIEDYEIVGVD